MAKLSPQKSRRSPLDLLDRSMNPVLGVYVDQKVNVIGTYLYLINGEVALCRYLGGNLGEPGGDLRGKYVPAIFGAEHDVEMAGVDDVVIVFQGARCHGSNYTRMCGIVSIMSAKRYTYKLRPGALAREKLRREYGRTRWLWNEAVHTARSGQKPAPKKLFNWLTAARRDNDWLRDGSVVCQQQVLRDYSTAYSASFTVKGRGKPTIKTRKTHPRVTLNYTRRGFSLPTVPDSTGESRVRIRLAKIGDIPVVWSRELPSEPSSVRITEDACGDFWASFVVDVVGPVPLPSTGKSVGMDFGITTTVTTSVPDYDLPFHGHRRKVAKNLAKHQRRMAQLRKKRDDQSRRQYVRAKKKAARLHRTATRQATDTAYKWAHRICRDFDQLAVEDFYPKFMFSSTLARKAADARVGTVKRILIEVAESTGRNVVLVDPRYTTQECSQCAARPKRRLELSDRTYICSSCGFIADRDRNAALAMLNRAGFLPAESGSKTGRAISAASRVPTDSGIPRL